MKKQDLIVIIILSISLLFNIVCVIFIFDKSVFTQFITIDRLIAFITLQSVLFNIIFSQKSRLKNSTEIRSIAENTDNRLQIFEQKQDTESILVKRSLLEVQTDVRRMDRELKQAKRTIEHTEAKLELLKELLEKK